MIIDKNSWHYQLVDSMRSPRQSRPNNLCQYVRRVLLAMVAWACVIAVVCSMTIAGIWVFVWLPLQSLLMFTGLVAVERELLFVGSVVAGSEFVIGLVWFLVYLFNRSSAKIHDVVEKIGESWPKFTSIRKDGIVMGVLRDLKEKTCTMVTYK